LDSEAPEAAVLFGSAQAQYVIDYIDFNRGATLGADKKAIETAFEE